MNEQRQHKRSPLLTGMGIMGRAALSFQSPDPELASDGGADVRAAGNDLRKLVAALHREGIEVREGWG